MALGKTALYYRRNKKAREKKKAYDTKYHATPERKKYRAALNRERRKRGIYGKGGKDISHTKTGVTLEDKSKNRARNGAGGKSTLK